MLYQHEAKCKSHLFHTDCGSLENPGDGEVDLSNGTVYGSIVTYLCSEGYKLVGDVKRKCLYTGKWDNVMPTCVRNREFF